MEIRRDVGKEGWKEGGKVNESEMEEGIKGRRKWDRKRKKRREGEGDRKGWME